jgi:hypothetical protein
MKQQANAEYDVNKKHGQTIESKETSGVQKKQRSSIFSRYTIIKTQIAS